MSPWFRAWPLLCPLGLAAQNITLSDGNLLLSAGTTVHIDGPATFEIGSGASITNHGRIDLGTQAVLVEQPGAPVTGNGFEEATWPNTVPLVNLEPGGLGLRLTTAFAQGGLRVERGHVPRTAWNGAQGIARWYRVSVPGVTTEGLDAELRFDATELNGIMPSALALFHGPAEEGPWTSSPTLLNAPSQTLTAAAPAPEIVITAFDLDAVSSTGVRDSEGWACWPAAVVDECWIKVPKGTVITDATLLDAAGRFILRLPLAAVEGIAHLALPDLASGAYLIQVNRGERTFKIMKS